MVEMIVIDVEGCKIERYNFRHDQSMKLRPEYGLSSDNDRLVMERVEEISDDERGR